MAKRKNAAAVELANRRMVTMTKEERQEVARSGGLKGGPARWEGTTEEERTAAASAAAKARWANAKKKAQKADEISPETRAILQRAEKTIRRARALVGKRKAR
jgi:hypothetical protein